MMMDRIADMLTRIRNAQTAGIEKIEMPASNILLAMAEILKADVRPVRTTSGWAISRARLSNQV